MAGREFRHPRDKIRLQRVAVVIKRNDDVAIRQSKAGIPRRDRALPLGAFHDYDFWKFLFHSLFGVISAAVENHDYFKWLGIETAQLSKRKTEITFAVVRRYDDSRGKNSSDPRLCEFNSICRARGQFGARTCRW